MTFFSNPAYNKIAQRISQKRKLEDPAVSHLSRYGTSYGLKTTVTQEPQPTAAEIRAIDNLKKEVDAEKTKNQELQEKILNQMKGI